MSEQRKYVQDGVEYCWCTKHQGYSPCNEFSASNRIYHGYHYYCRKCSSELRIDRKKFPRHKIIDDKEYCYCSQHKEYHLCDEFQLSNSKGYGYQYNCKEINSMIHNDRTNKFSSDIDRELSNMILNRMGYNTNGDIPVHEQFKMKHDL